MSNELDNRFSGFLLSKISWLLFRTAGSKKFIPSKIFRILSELNRRPSEIGEHEIHLAT